MNSLFDRILDSDEAFFRHQKQEEEDLTDQDKRKIVEDLYSANKSLFIQRYNRFLTVEDCSLFDSEDDFIIQHFLKQIRNSQKGSEKLKRNRRFLYMQQLKKEGKFFSDERMREREPFLFDKMIGRHLTEEERMHLRPTVDRVGGWAGMLSQFEESMEVAERRNEHDVTWDRKENDPHSRLFAHIANKYADDDEFVAERDSEDEGEEGSEEERRGGKEGGSGMEEMQREVERMHNGMMEECDEEDDDETRESGRRDFEDYMEQRFLTGKDNSFFDYTKCDNDQNLDDRDPTRERDIEEKWFEDDE